MSKRATYKIHRFTLRADLDWSDTVSELAATGIWNEGFDSSCFSAFKQHPNWHLPEEKLHKAQTACQYSKMLESLLFPLIWSVAGKNIWFYQVNNRVGKAEQSWKAILKRYYGDRHDSVHVNATEWTTICATTSNLWNTIHLWCVMDSNAEVKWYKYIWNLLIWTVSVGSSKMRPPVHSHSPYSSGKQSVPSLPLVLQL